MTAKAKIEQTKKQKESQKSTNRIGFNPLKKHGPMGVPQEANNGLQNAMMSGLKLKLAQRKTAQQNNKTATAPAQLISKKGMNQVIDMLGSLEGNAK